MAGFHLVFALKNFLSLVIYSVCVGATEPLFPVTPGMARS